MFNERDIQKVQNIKAREEIKQQLKIKMAQERASIARGASNDEMGFNMKKFIAIAAVLLITMTAVGAATGAFEELMTRINPAWEEIVDPIGVRDEYDGFRMEVGAGAVHDDTLITFLSVQDTTGQNRLSERSSFDVTIYSGKKLIHDWILYLNPYRGEAFDGTFDAETNTMTFQIRLDVTDTNLENEINFELTSVKFDRLVYDEFVPMVDTVAEPFYVGDYFWISSQIEGNMLSIERGWVLFSDQNYSEFQEIYDIGLYDSADNQIIQKLQQQGLWGASLIPEGILGSYYAERFARSRTTREHKELDVHISFQRTRSSDQRTRSFEINDSGVDQDYYVVKEPDDLWVEQNYYVEKAVVELNDLDIENTYYKIGVIQDPAQRLNLRASVAVEVYGAVEIEFDKPIAWLDIPEATGVKISALRITFVGKREYQNNGFWEAQVGSSIILHGEEDYEIRFESNPTEYGDTIFQISDYTHEAFRAFFPLGNTLESTRPIDTTQITGITINGRYFPAR